VTAEITAAVASGGAPVPSAGVPSSGSSTLLGGRFLVESEVGRGGVGIVYRARDQMSGQLVALKVIAITGVDASEEARFAREGRVLAGLSHPGIVRVVAFGQLERNEEQRPYIAMEWLDGVDLSERLKKEPLDMATSLVVGAEIAEALAAAHAAGIVHRDVKPSNIILVRRSDAAGAAAEASSAGSGITAKLVDFGVASAEDVKLTRTGAILGTPAYMAPEQARGDGEVTAQADLYALGATLFEMLTGRAPHVGPTPIAILARLVTMAAPRLSEMIPEVPEALDQLVGELLATAPEERPHSATVVAERLRAIAAELGVASQVVHRSSDAGLDEPPPSSRLSMVPMSSTGAGGSRLITSILATRVPKGSPRARMLTHLRARGADATELGGDAIIAHLGTRQALGDEAARALELGQRLAKLNAQVGIATGRTKLARARPTGEVVDRAAALSRDAQRGQVLADTTTSELARGRYEFQLRSDGTAVVGEALRGGERNVGGAPFVGRDAEMAQLVTSFQRSAEDETPVVVTVTGPPGIGKTRLRREALSRFASLPDAPRSVHVRCDSFAKGHALGVVADIARVLAGLPKGTNLEDARVAADALVLGHGANETRPGSPARERLARLMANQPLEIDGDRGARDAVWIALTDMLLGITSKGALAIAIEDGQWADAESLAWLDHVLGRAGGKPLWIMMTTRPTLWRDDPSRFSGRDHVRIELRPLSRRTVRTIARTILAERAAGAEGEALTEWIADQAAGSPLFAEELSRLAAAGKDATRAATIEAAIQVHLDALDDAGRDAAARLAVFGMNGWDAGMEALGVAKASDVLRSLASVEVLVEQAESRFTGMREWGFKHALMREVAYAALGEDALKTLHALAGQWLASVGEDDAIVARHLELGGESVLASGYMEKAARRALATNALGQAVELAERALAFAEEKPTQFARAQLLDEAWSRLDARAGERDSAVRAMQEAIFDTASAVRAQGARVRYEDACGGDGETSARLEQVRKDAQAAQLYDEEARCAAALAARCAYAGQMDRAAEVADELLALAREQGIAGAAVVAWQTLAVVRQARGDVGPALDARREAAKSARDASLKTREATLTINVGFALTTVGAKEEARKAIEEGIALAQEVGSPGTVRHGQMNLLCWAATFGPDASGENFHGLLDEPRLIADSAVSGSWVPHDRATLGVLFYRGLELLRGEGPIYAERARTLLRTAADGYRATGMLDVVPVAIGLLAEAERRCGEPMRGRELSATAAQLLDDGHPSLLNEAPIFLALHDACIDTGDLPEAKEAIARGVPHLVTRIEGLARTPYAYGFLTNLVPNAGLLAAALAYDLVPPALAAILEAGRG
jgi:serine/threonine protein kinase/tetratricopeptide (TPR) repeat protein